MSVGIAGGTPEGLGLLSVAAETLTGITAVLLHPSAAALQVSTTIFVTILRSSTATPAAPGKSTKCMLKNMLQCSTAAVADGCDLLTGMRLKHVDESC